MTATRKTHRNRSRLSDPDSLVVQAMDALKTNQAGLAKLLGSTSSSISDFATRRARPPNSISHLLVCIIADPATAKRFLAPDPEQVSATPLDDDI